MPVPMTEVLVLKGKLDVRAVKNLYTQLESRLGNDVQIDMGQVTHIGALCLQTLFAASIALRGDTRRLILENVDPLVEAQIEMMGMTSHKIMEGTL
jgi:anti-anti-sigma regulatory factor